MKMKLVGYINPFLEIFPAPVAPVVEMNTKTFVYDKVEPTTFFRKWYFISCIIVTRLNKGSSLTVTQSA